MMAVRGTICHPPHGTNLAAGSAYAAIGNLVYSRDLDVPNHLKRRPQRKGFDNIEKDLIDAIHTAYGGSAKAK